MGLGIYFSLQLPTRAKAFQRDVTSSISWWCSKKHVLVLPARVLLDRWPQLLTEPRICVSEWDINQTLLCLVNLLQGAEKGAASLQVEKGQRCLRETRKVTALCGRTTCFSLRSTTHEINLLYSAYQVRGGEKAARGGADSVQGWGTAPSQRALHRGVEGCQQDWELVPL